VSRLSERRGELIDRGRTITFSWEGKTYKGHKGDTISRTDAERHEPPRVAQRVFTEIGISIGLGQRAPRIVEV